MNEGTEPMSNEFQQRIEALEHALDQERSARRATEAKLRRWALRAVIATSVVVGGGLLGRIGIAHAACTATLPAPLTTFCPNEPARAASVNANFQTIASNIVNKIGALGSTDATMPRAVTTSIVATSSGAGTVTVGSNLTVTGSASLGGVGTLTTMIGQVKMLGTSSSVAVGGSAVVAASDGLVIVAYSGTGTQMNLVVGGAVRSATYCAGGTNTLVGFVRKGESYNVTASAGYALQGSSFVAFGT